MQRNDGASGLAFEPWDSLMMERSTFMKGSTVCASAVRFFAIPFHIVLVQASSVPGNKDPKEPDNENVRHVTWTPAKIENGVLRGPVLADPNDLKLKVTLWESTNGGSYEDKSTPNGSGKDRILTGAGILSTPVDQHWSVNGERVQVVVGKNPDGTVQTTWQHHVDRSGDVPRFTPVATPAPQ
jgi:hypothetical protein